jgi:hypothetical protein
VSELIEMLGQEAAALEVLAKRFVGGITTVTTPTC